MARKRHKLKVDTFPFLAVLLCAMGALILLLFVFDRRAKFVAKNKALALRAERLAKLEANRSNQQDHLEKIAKQKLDWEAERQRIRDALEKQHRSLEARVADVDRTLKDVAGRVETHQTAFARLRQALDAEIERLGFKKTELLAKQKAFVQSAAEKHDRDADERLKLTRELLLLEASLRTLKEHQARQKERVSLVPYKGKQGDNRPPIYIECRRDGLIFQPGGQHLAQLLPPIVRDEISKRTGPLALEKNADKNRDRPYVLFLVRPEGIPVYYQAQKALDGWSADFGYEFVDSGWVFDFGDGVDQQPWRQPPSVAVGPRTNPPAQPVGRSFGIRTDDLSGPEGVEGTPPGSRPGPFARPPLGMGNGPGIPVQGIPSPPGSGNGPNLQQQGIPSPQGTAYVPGSPPQGFPQIGRKPPEDGPRIAPPPFATNTPNGGPRQANSGIELPPTVQLGTPRPEGPGSSEVGEPGADRPSPIHSTMPQMPSGPRPPQNTPSRPGSQEAATGDAPPNLPGGIRPPGQIAKEGAASPGSASVASPGGPPSDEPASSQPPSLLHGPEVLQGPVQPKTPRPSPLSRLLGNRDFIIHVNCHADGAVLVARDELYPTVAEEAKQREFQQLLAQNIRDMVRRRQATVRPGEPPYRPMIRLKVAADGLRTYYWVYPALENIGIPMTRENVEE